MLVCLGFLFVYLIYLLLMSIEREWGFFFCLYLFVCFLKREVGGPLLGVEDMGGVGRGREKYNPNILYEENIFQVFFKD